MIQDRVQGVLLGLAVGDFHGGPIRMAIRLAESLSDCGQFRADDVFNRYIGWYREGAFDTGPVAEKALARVAEGEQVPDAASREAALTHFDPLAGDVSAAVVVLCRALILGRSWPDALDASMVGRTDLTRRALSVVGWSSLDKGGYAPNVLAAAVHFLDGYNEFCGALDASFAFAGGGNYCPVLVGAIGGARWGINAVPLDRVRHTELLTRMRIAATRLSAIW